MKIKFLKISFVLLVILGFLNKSYAYEWHRIFEINGVQYFWHIEKLKKNKKGNYLLWTMSDLGSVNSTEKNPMNSMIQYMEIDCNLRRTRMIYMELYSQNMAKGKLDSALDFEQMPFDIKKWLYGAKNDPRTNKILSFCDS